MTSVVAAEGLSVTYPGRRGWAGLGPPGDPVVALGDVSLAVAPGEAVALVGESGSGKTTLGRCLVALLRPSAGRVLFGGTDLATVPPRELRGLRRRFQPIFQDPSLALPPHLRVASIVAEPLVIHGLAQSDLADRVAAALAQVGLGPELLDRLPHQLSGGQRQRVAIARALLLEPELLVADEPVSALDASVRRGVLALLAERRQALGLALVLVSHELGGLAELVDRVAVLYAGRLVEVGAAKTVLERPRHPYTASLLAASRRRAAGGSKIPWAEPATDGCAFAPRCPAAGELCRRERPLLVAAGGGSAAACHFPAS